MEIACAATPNYLRHVGTMLHSMLSHTSRRPLRVSLLHEQPLPPDDLERLRQVVERQGASLRTVAVPAALMEGFPGTRNFPSMVWLRVLLPTLLPDADRVLYLDADVIVTDDLAPLWDTELDDHLFGAVTNPCYPGLPPPAALGLSRPEHYLNSGVLLLNLGRMRAEGCIDQLRDFATAHPDNPCPEQDALSALYHDRCLLLHPRWNVQAICYERPAGRLPFPSGQAAEALGRPAVVHFSGIAKPWHYLCRHPLRHRYFEHLDQTPWPRLPLEGGGLSHRLFRPLPTPWQFVVAGRVGRLRRLRMRVAAWLSDSTAGSITRDAFRLLTPRRTRPILEQTLEAFAAESPSAVFVQVGSNDAHDGDPLRRFIAEREWRGILTEPVPYVYERLRRRYGHHPRLVLENLAIADHDGSADFYHLAQSHDPLPHWYDQLGSFSPETVLKHLDEIPDIAQRMRVMRVQCMSFESLCRKHGLTQIDLIHIDAEGYDDVILRSIDLRAHRPTMMIYEHKHLGTQRRAACRELVEAQGYESLEIGADTLCLARTALHSSFSRLARAWRIANRAHAAGAVPFYYADPPSGER
jgi:FkbM family methyltransferase